MKKIIVFFLCIAVFSLVPVWGQKNISSPALITPSEFGFGEFKMVTKFNKNEAQLIYGAHGTFTIPKEKMEEYARAVDEKKRYEKDYVLYVYETAAFLCDENDYIFAATSTCEKGSNPRSVKSYYDSQRLIETFGKPIEVMMFGGGKLWTFYNVEYSTAPTFKIYLYNKEHIKGGKNFLISWGQTPLYTTVCLTLFMGSKGERLTK